MGRTVPDGARQRYALRALLRPGGLQQLPSRHALQTVWPDHEGPEHVRRNVGDDHQHHRSSGGPSRNLPAVLVQLQVRMSRERDATRHARFWLSSGDADSALFSRSLFSFVLWSLAVSADESKRLAHSRGGSCEIYIFQNILTLFTKIFPIKTLRSLQFFEKLCCFNIRLFRILLANTLL